MNEHLHEHVMGLKEILDIVVALSTLALAFYTWRLARATVELAKDSRESSYRQIGSQMWIEFTKRFDSHEMLKARKELAAMFKDHRGHPPDPVPEIVHNFFEDLGVAYRHGYVNKELTANSFGYYACRWWVILRPDVLLERAGNIEDPWLSKFEYLVTSIRNPTETIGEAQIREFLNEEIDLLESR